MAGYCFKQALPPSNSKHFHRLPPDSGLDSTDGLCHPSRAFEQATNHLQPTGLLSTNLKPEPNSTTHARA
ncbi:hypothetical protein CROQUDRAFT_86139 [Cronartium quercuum f. sp. fusiforme G11]|uniref:Uncharacterized protein n=1 Tax=Cronartium quercuum f. sp. fusiforme G11 TaxID=708437 RepID=A0A9P6THN5_9BASI|nr:hypothetical protein CROQUDRAFT_86139 [Cronartium quercuum f. sp. fusiforme G11]